MPSISVSSAKASSVHLKQTLGGTAVKATVTKILSWNLKQRSSPHCMFSVAWGKARQKSRSWSTVMGVSWLACTSESGMLAYALQDDTADFSPYPPCGVVFATHGT